MSVRSLYNNDMILKNLTITGELTLENPIEYDNMTLENLSVTNDTSLNILNVSGETVFDNNVQMNQNLTVNANLTGHNITSNNLTTEDFTCSSITNLNTLDVSSTATLHATTNCNVLNVTGVSTFNSNVDVCQNMVVEGNLTVQGNLIANLEQNNLEILYYNMTGNTSSVNQTMTLSLNTTTTNYSVFPSYYFGYSGSSGTYNISQTSGALSQILITQRNPGNFQFFVNKTTGDNINVMIVFLVVYNVSSSAYPSSWS